ncbi:hypothetical protein ABB02_01881 [Clostridiaceae bacterium JG1575]|nr:hypothetical protein ABB02_01881 [Clostridiaceae bacterium JG1575]
MKEITINAMRLQWHRHKGLILILLLVPAFLGLGFGAVKGTSSGGGKPNQEQSLLNESKSTQYHALQNAYDAQLLQIKSSIYLNLDPAAVPTSYYTIYVESLLPQSDEGRWAGNYYAYLRMNESDFDAMRKIAGNPNLTDAQLEELISVLYNKDISLLQLTVVYPDLKVAQRLGEYQYQRLMKAYEGQKTKTHALHLLGVKHFIRVDEGIPVKLNQKMAVLDDYKKRMEGLAPSVQMAPNSIAAGGALSVRSLAKWGILGTFFGVALSLLGLVALAGREKSITDPRGFAQAEDLRILGYVPSPKAPKYWAKILKAEGVEKGTGHLVASLALQMAASDPPKLVLAGGELPPAAAEELQKVFPELTLFELSDLDAQSAKKMRGASAALLLARVDAAADETVRTLDLLRESGLPLAGILFVS